MEEYKPVQKILYATDFSESSKPACRFASYLAKTLGAKLHILHCIGTNVYDEQRTMMQKDAFEKFDAETKKNAIEQLHELCPKRFAGIDHETEVVMGKPFKLIREVAERENVDLIVMGTHGRTGIEHVILGSTAERVVRRSKIPVLTVRGEDE